MNANQKESEQVALRARDLVSTLPAKITDRWMFAPAGTHTITPAAGEGSAEVTVRIDETTVPVLNAALAKINAVHAPQRAFFDREHDEAAGATAWPLRFLWANAPQPGVYCEHEPSALGRELVEGKVMRAFSPGFFADADLPKKIPAGKHVKIAAGKRGSVENPARIIGLPFPACGTLTNNPAFKKILPLWAKQSGPDGPPPCRTGQAGAHSSETKPPHYMNKKTPEELVALRARKSELEQLIPTLKAKDQTDAANVTELQNAETELAGVDAQLNAEALRARNETLEQAVLDQRTKDADEAVKAAVKRGAIPPKDDALQAKWKKRCIEDPENIELLASMKGSPALERQRLTLSGVHVTKEDALTVLRAYNAERDPRKKGALYARELSKRITDGEPLPLMAANTLGTLAGEIVTQRTLELLVLKLPLLQRVGTDFSDQSASFNQAIKSRIVGIPTVDDYDEDDGYSTQDSTTTDVPVTIDQHKSCQVSFGVNELAATNRRLFDELAPAMQYAIGKDMCDALYALILASNFTETATIKALNAFDRKTVVAIAGTLSDRGVPDMGRTLLLNGPYFDELFSDSAIVNLATFQRSDIITQGQMIPLHGFDIIRASNLPSTGNLTGFGFSKSALVLATRLPNDYAAALPGASGGGTTQTITEPNTGLSVMLVQFIDHQLGKAFARIALMYGVAKGQIKAGQLLISATPSP